MSDVISHPDHYAGHGIECMDAMRSMMYGADVTNSQAYWWGCIFKYVWRFAKKNGVEDLKKARQCIGYLIEDLENEQNAC